MSVQISGSIIQPWAKDVAEFVVYYQKTLDLLAPQAGRVFTVSPLFIGEDASNGWNQNLAALAEAIQSISAHDEHVGYINLRADFIAALDNHHISPYQLTGAIRVILDAVLLRSGAQVDRQAASRGLQLTLDGVHLNSRGARLVAGRFVEAIKTVN
ncbi:MAG: hypothetical protein JW953_14100 [Anaerolineae bacterium]|nr:hypothetical protein [Anaerolineae bacterium]